MGTEGDHLLALLVKNVVQAKRFYAPVSNRILYHES